MALAYHALSAASNRGTPQGTTDIVAGTDIRDVSDTLDLLALADTPFINRIGWGPETGATSIEWISEDLGPGYLVVASVAGSAGTSFLVNTVEGMTAVESTKQVHSGSLLYHYSSTDGEHGLMILLSAGGAAATADLEREQLSGVTGFTDTSMTIGDKLWVLGPVANEGSLPRRGEWRTRVVTSNPMTILREDIQITGSAKATDMYAVGREDKHQMLMRMKEIVRSREKVALYSAMLGRSATVASHMNGALGFLIGQTGANIDITTTALTETAVNTVVSTIWESGGSNLTFYGNIDQTAKFTRWDKNRIRMAPSDHAGGGLVTHYMTEAGIDLEIVPMRKVPTNIAFVIDNSKCKLRAKRGRKGIMEKLGKAGDMDDWQIITEFSLEMKGYNLHQHGLFTRLT